MKHTLNTSGLTHTIEMSPAEALALISRLAECVRLAVGPSQIPSYVEHDLEVFNDKLGRNIAGGLTLIVRP